MAITATATRRLPCDADGCLRAGTVHIAGCSGFTIDLCRHHARKLRAALTSALDDYAHEET